MTTVGEYIMTKDDLTRENPICRFGLKLHNKIYKISINYTIYGDIFFTLITNR